MIITIVAIVAQYSKGNRIWLYFMLILACNIICHSERFGVITPS